MSNPHGEFRKSTRSDSAGNCVEVADFLDGSGVLVRDSKDQAGPTLNVPAGGWGAFIAATKDGKFDLA